MEIETINTEINLLDQTMKICSEDKKNGSDNKETNATTNNSENMDVDMDSLDLT